MRAEAEKKVSGKLPIEDLNPGTEKTRPVCLSGRKKAYAPYSKFLVGCAVRDVRGKIHHRLQRRKRFLFGRHLRGADRTGQNGFAGHP